MTTRAIHLNASGCVFFFIKGYPPDGAKNFIPELSKIDSAKNWDFTVLALGNSAYLKSFINFAVEAKEALGKNGCTPVTPIHVADELKNQDDAFCEWEKKLYGDSSSVLYLKNTASEATFDTSSTVDQGGKKMKLTYNGSAPLTKSATTIGNELNRLIENNFMDSWNSHNGTLLDSTDLFSFKARGNTAHEFLYSGTVQAGDHMGE